MGIRRLNSKALYKALDYDMTHEKIFYQSRNEALENDS